MQRLINLFAYVAYWTGFVHLCLWVRQNLLRRYGVYILNYHHVVPKNAGTTSRHDVTVAQLEWHLRFVTRWFHLIALEDVPALLAGPTLDRDYLVITFDDGYEDNYLHALPLLRRHGVPATVFLIAGLTGTGALPWYDQFAAYLPQLTEADVSGVESTPLDRIWRTLTSIMSRPIAMQDRIERALSEIKAVPADVRASVLELMIARFGHARDPRPANGSRLVTWDQARDMMRHGISLGSHTLTHPILTMLSAPQVEAELDQSTSIIERRLERPCRTFAFPNGDFDEVSVELLRSRGFRAACTQEFGANRPGTDPLALRRIGVGCTPGYVLAAKLCGLFAPAFALRHLHRAWVRSPQGPRRLLAGDGWTYRRSIPRSR